MISYLQLIAKVANYNCYFNWLSQLAYVLSRKMLPYELQATPTHCSLH